MHPPEAAGTRYVQAIGGIDATIARAKEFYDAGDLRFAAELASHAVFAGPDNVDARELLAAALEQLGYGAENATWRNSFLTGAQELRTNTVAHTDINSAGLAPALTVTQLFDSVAIRIDGPAAWDAHLTIAWHITDADEYYRMELSNGVLIHHPTASLTAADVTITATHQQLVALLMAGSADGVTIDGDSAVLATLIGHTDQPNPDFAIVTP